MLFAKPMDFDLVNACAWCTRKFFDFVSIYDSTRMIWVAGLTKFDKLLFCDMHGLCKRFIGVCRQDKTA